MKAPIIHNIISVFLIFCLGGCNSVSTFNYDTSQTVIRSAVAENKAPKELNNKALAVFITGQKKQQIKIKNTEKDDYGEAVIDGNSFAAFLFPPGSFYCNQKKFTFKPNSCYFFAANKQNVSPISIKIFQEKYANKYLTEQRSFFGDIISADNYFSDKVSSIEVFAHNTGCVIGYTLVGIGCVALAAVLLPLVLADIRYSGGAVTSSIVREPSKNAYGPGVHADQYGRPVKWQVQGNSQADTTLLDVKPNVYGPGIGSDQYGRPVKLKPAY